MRVYQFRHIRADRQCSDAIPPSTPRPDASCRSHNRRPRFHRRNTALRRLAYHDRRAAGSLHLRAGPARTRDGLGARRAAGAASNLVEVVVSLSQKPLATTTWRAGGSCRRGRSRTHSRASRRGSRKRRPGRSDPLALQARRERAGRRRPQLAARRGWPRSPASRPSIRASATALSSTAARSRSAHPRSGAPASRTPAKG